MSPSDGQQDKSQDRFWTRPRWGAGLVVPVLAAISLVSILALALLFAVTTHQNTLRRAENECQRMVAVGAEHVGRIAEEAGRSLHVIAQWLERNPDAPLDSPDLIALAQALGPGRDRTRAIAIIDSTGQAVLLDSAMAGKRFDVSDRPYFPIGRDGPEQTVLFAPPLRNAYTDAPMVAVLYKIRIERRVSIIATTFSAARLHDVMMSLLAEDQSSLRLRDGDKLLVEAFRNGTGAGAPAQPGAAAATDQLMAVPTASADLIACSRAVAGTSLRVEGELSRAAVLHGWSNAILASSGLLLVVLALVVFLSVQLTLFYRRLRTSEESLRESLAHANEANQAKTLFLANTSHELRTPLNAIIGFSELIERQAFGPVPEKYRAYVSDILQSGRHLLSIVNQLLDMAAVEANRDRLERRPMDPRAALAGAVAMVRGMAETAGVAIELDPGDLPASMIGNARAFRQIVANLVSNAVKFSQQGGHVWVAARADGADAIVLTVLDEGIGMSAEDRAKLFTPFWRGEHVWTRRSDGLGLGLALTKRLIEGLGGRIEVESEPGKGSRFTVRLPVNPPEANGRPA
jgi:signal transduction histidine kinase